MSENNLITRYVFSPHHRMGLSSFLLNKESYSGKKRATIPTKLNLKAQTIEDEITTKEIEKIIHLYGPVDIDQFSKDSIKSIDPQNDVGDFEPNYFPAITFWDPDYPWRYTPYGEDNEGNLMPWLTLIVLVAENKNDFIKEFETPDAIETNEKSDNKNIPFIKNVPFSSLPNLDHCWRWAHMQVIGEYANSSGDEDGEFSNGFTEAQLKEILSLSPENITSRLLCTRRLAPGILYNAFLVPTFKLSLVAAGIIEDNENYDATTLAWENSSNGKISLPYYHRWEFRTGQRGDFEELVRRIEPVIIDDIGLRDMNCNKPGYKIEGLEHNGDPLVLSFEGALKSLNVNFEAWGEDSTDTKNKPENLQKDLQNLLNINSELLIQKIEIRSNNEDFEIQNGVIKLLNNEINVSFDTTEQNTYRAKFWVKPNDVSSKDFTVSNNDTKYSCSINQNLDENEEYKLVIEAKNSDGTYSAITKEYKFTYKPINLLLPPKYGKWHYGSEQVNADLNPKSWFHELNLDPRHRAAAGLGAEVMRNKQEEFMALAWELAGDLDFANHLVEVSKLGIAISRNYLDRIKRLSDVAFLAQTSVLHSRIFLGDDSAKMMLKSILKKSIVPSATLTPAYKKLNRTKGPLKKHLLRNGFVGKQSVVESYNNIENPFSVASSQLESEFIVNIGNEANPTPGTDVNFGEPNIGIGQNFKRIGNSIQQKKIIQQKNVLLKKSIDEYANQIISSIQDGKNINETVKRNSESLNKISKILSDNNINLNEFYIGIAKTLKEEGIKPNTSNNLTAFDKQLMAIYNAASSESVETPPILDIKKFRTSIQHAIAPEATISNRTRHRLVGAVINPNKPVEKIMAAPEYKTPMYKPLEQLSQDYIIPGIEKIKQNKVTVLSTNNRFIEAYMVGINHACAEELKWREYSTDQKGTYCKHFWKSIENDDIEKAILEYLGLPENTELTEEQKKIVGITKKKVYSDIKPIHEWDENKLGNNQSELAFLRSGSTKQIIDYVDNAILEFLNIPIDGEKTASQLQQINQLKGKIKNDITSSNGNNIAEMTANHSELGHILSGKARNNKGKENIVICMRGDLLKKYPDTDLYIFKVTPAPPDDIEIDDFFSILQQTLEEKNVIESTCLVDKTEIYQPFFGANLPPDISVVGFNLKVPEIRKEGDKFYFVIEERINRVRYGMDVKIPRNDENEIPDSWDNLSWEHFGLKESYGQYLNDIEIENNSKLKSDWNEWSSFNAGEIASKTQQKPVRLAIALNEMIPKEVL